MTLVHNIIIRSLNAIYINAPLVRRAGAVRAFTAYTLEALDVIHQHHEHEESTIFPALQKASIDMQMNLDQHESFSASMEALKHYCQSVRSNSQSYSGEKMQDLVKAFGDPLVQHLTEEVCAA